MKKTKLNFHWRKYSDDVKANVRQPPYQRKHIIQVASNY